MRLIAVLMLISLLFGCETTKRFLGISTKGIERLRPQAEVEVVNADYTTAYNRVLDVLEEEEMDSYIYSKNENMIAIYKSSTDTTPVGIFFRRTDKDRTQIEISSQSTPAKREIAEKIFNAFSTD